MGVQSSNQITLIDVTDAYSVILTSEAYTFIGTTSGAPTGSTCSTQAVAFCGSNPCSEVNVDADDIICPAGISASVEDNGTSAPTIKFTTNSVIDESCEATIPVVVDGITVNKKFSFSVAMKGDTGAKGATGAAGKGISSIVNHYLATSAGTGVTTSTSGWSTTIQNTTTTNKYLWCYQTINYTSGSPTNTTPVIIGTHGATGATGAKGDKGNTGNGIKSITNKYLTTASGSGVTTSTSGWSTTPTATSTSKKYIWCYQEIVYTDGTTAKTTPAIIGTHGATGATGASGKDAIVISITASNGTVFKNNSGTTVLTAHVYKGGVEQSITDDGVCASLGSSIKWYKGNSTTPIATAKSITVSAADVTNTAAYICKSED